MRQLSTIRKIWADLLERIRIYTRPLGIRFERLFHIFGVLLLTLSYSASVTVLVALILYTGFDHSELHSIRLHELLGVARFIVLLTIVRDLLATLFDIRILTSSSDSATGTRLRIGVSLAVLLSYLPYPPFGFSVYQGVSLAAWAIIDISNGVMHLVSRRTNPSLLLSGSFIAFILLGTLLLMLPKCTYDGITPTDALFISTSAVCITGLCPIDIYVHFTPLGILVLALLIQIGGLGVMTFTSFFALFFSGRASVYNQLLLKDMIYSRSMSALIPTLLYILGFTLVVEAIGAVILFVSVHETLGLTPTDELIFCAFHSLSSFCNAGFTTMPGGLSNPILLYSNQSIYWITSMLVILGGIGFPILVNFKDALFDAVRRQWKLLRHKPCGPRRVHQYDMNTLVVLTTTTILFVAGAVLFWLLEHNNTLVGKGWWWQLSQSVFNSVTPRSAGFSSVNPGGFLNVTLLLIMVLMWIGGASQSTAGGIKVNTFAAICLNIKAIVCGQQSVNVFRRNIGVWSLRRANAVVAISILSYIVFSMLALSLEPDLSPRAVLFETLSALFTVGSSLGITGQLSVATKILLCTAMFLGRVGMLSLLTGLVGTHRHRAAAISYPTDNLIIN